jgi:hypothetical protein
MRSISENREESSVIITAKASGDPDVWGRGESEVAMKSLCVGVLLALTFLVAQKASADPCGLCQAYYPCSWSCENCVAGREGPGLWVDGGYCWGTVEEATCGDSGQSAASRFWPASRTIPIEAVRSSGQLSPATSQCSGGASAASWHSAPAGTQSAQLLLAQITAAAPVH